MAEREEQLRRALSDRTAANVHVTRAFYQATTDAAGYPNGLPYWHEVPVETRYFDGATAIALLEMLARDGLIELKAPIGLDGAYDGPDCTRFREELARTIPEETARFEEYAAQMRASYAESKEKDEGE